jgi:hypothetical protein
VGVGSQRRGAGRFVEVVQFDDVNAVAGPGLFDPHGGVLSDGDSCGAIGAVEFRSEAFEVARGPFGKVERPQDLRPDAFPDGRVHQPEGHRRGVKAHQGAVAPDAVGEKRRGMRRRPGDW